MTAIWRAIARRFQSDPDAGLRATLENLIEDHGDDERPLAEEEREVIANSIKLRDLTVRDVMIPRPDILAIDEESSLADYLRVQGAEGYSRLPVYRDGLDNIIGMIHIKDVLPHWGRQEVAIKTLIRDVLYVPSSMQAYELLGQMRLTRTHLAIVVDEFGGTDGLVTMSDLIEEIVGELGDEHDEMDEGNILTRPDGSYFVRGRTPLEELEKLLGFDPAEDLDDDIDTVGGLISTLAGEIPKRGQVVDLPPHHLSFEVLDGDGRRLKWIRVKREAVSTEM
jgi:CBS domain containing-hemolysin-like protein